MIRTKLLGSQTRPDVRRVPGRAGRFGGRDERAEWRISRGMGFGLAIARRIVQDHGGTIRAESPEGKGAIFTIEFPLPKTRSGA